MSTDRDLNRIVRSWLDEGATSLPDRVLDAVLDQVPATPQRRPSWLARRTPTMNNTVRFALAAATVVAVALIGYQLLIGPNVGGPGPAPSLTPAASSEPTASAIPALNGQAPLDPGQYRVTGTGLPIGITVTVPEGWGASGNWVLIGPNGNDLPNGMAIRFYAVQNLYLDPYAPDNGTLDPRVGPSVDDLVSAILNHADWTGAEASDVVVDGYSGQVVRFTLPPEVGTPGHEDFYFFIDPGGTPGAGSGIWGFEPGQVFDFYIVDVNGQRLVFDVWHYPGTSEADLAAQQAVVDSIQLAPSP